MKSAIVIDNGLYYLQFHSSALLWLYRLSD